MKKRILIVLFSALFMAVLGWVLGGREIFQRTGIPQEISEFYEDYNFVSSFSSCSERKELLSYFAQKRSSREFKSDRLEQVFHRMKKLMGRVLEVDSKMVYPEKPGGFYIFRSELIEVKNFSRNDKEAEVKVSIYLLGPEVILRFISQYEVQGGDEEKIPSIEQRIRAADSGSAPRIEVHKWILTNGGWKKKGFNLIFIKDKK